MGKSAVKSLGLTERGPPKLPDSRAGEGSGIPGVAVKCVEIRWNTGGEGGSLDGS